MNKLQFDFIVDKENNTMTIRREFDAERQLVWDCYTKSELLNRWFAPEPFTTKTKSMDFSEGGYWHYAMIDPEGAEYWGRMDYLKINPIDSYTALDGFCDENGTLTPDLPQGQCDVTFTDKGERSVVQSVFTYKSLADIETVVNMGMEEGLASALERLDSLLAELKK